MNKAKLTLIKSFPLTKMDPARRPSFSRSRANMPPPSLRSVPRQPKPKPTQGQFTPHQAVDIYIKATADLLDSIQLVDYQTWATLTEYNRYILNHGTSDQKLDQLAFLTEYDYPDPYSDSGSLKEDFMQALEGQMKRKKSPETYSHYCRSKSCSTDTPGKLTLFEKIKHQWLRLVSPHPTFELPPKYYQAHCQKDALSFHTLSKTHRKTFKQSLWVKELEGEHRELNHRAALYDTANERLLETLWDARHELNKGLKNTLKLLARVNFFREKLTAQRRLVALLQREQKKLFQS